MSSLLDKYISPWSAPWVRDGVIVVRTASQVYESKNGYIPADVQRLGCAGWDKAGVLHHVSIDLDVGHGGRFSYPDRAQALEKAAIIREFLGQKAEIRGSAGGNGLHIRIALKNAIKREIVHAARVARWIVAQCGVIADPSQLGRQCLDFWSAKPSQDSFKLYEPSEGPWEEPPESFAEPLPPPAPTYSENRPRNEIIDRAALYMRHVDPAVSGSGGHAAAFRAACILTHGFYLSAEEARPLYYDWNKMNQPPFNERDLEHKLESAAKATGERGYLLTEKGPDSKSGSGSGLSVLGPSAPQLVTAPPPQSAVSKLFQQFRDEASGRRYACNFPWPMLSRLSMALLPSTITIVSGPRGGKKSQLIGQSLAHWYALKYKFAALFLEEDKAFYLRRMLAQRTGCAELLDPEEIKKNPDLATWAEKEHETWLNEMNERIWEADATVTTHQMVAWLKGRAKDGTEIAVVDPISIRDNGGKPWIDDKLLMAHTRDMLKTSVLRVIFVTHPPKPFGGQSKKGGSASATSGGKEIENMASSVLLLDPLGEPDQIVCRSAHYTKSMPVNLKIKLDKTRSGKGAGEVIGFWWDCQELTLREQGVIVQ